MPWTTPTLRQSRIQNRDFIAANLKGSDANIPNNVLRVMSDMDAGNAHLALQYLDWQSDQYLPDTSETEWLDRHGQIWLKNADGTVGRKGATFASGTALVTSTVDQAVLPTSTGMLSGNQIRYETTESVTLSIGVPTPVTILALDPGSDGNQDAGATLTITTPPPSGGVSPVATVQSLGGGTDQETDDDLRTRVLLRIQQPPMGGDQNDYVLWTLAVAGVTRAWCYPNEMGIGTVTVRFMMDSLRATFGGFPTSSDVFTVATYLNTVRPVAVKDFFPLAPTPSPINLTLTELSPNTPDIQAAIIASVANMFRLRAQPGDPTTPGAPFTMRYAWIDQAISETVGVTYQLLAGTDFVMASPGYMPTLGLITFPSA